MKQGSQHPYNILITVTKIRIFDINKAFDYKYNGKFHCNNDTQIIVSNSFSIKSTFHIFYFSDVRES